MFYVKGKIIDGRNRFLACKEAQEEPRFREWNGRGSLVGHVVSLNMKRRHLLHGQKSMIADKLRPLFAEEAKQNLSDAGKQYGVGQEKPSANLQNPIKPIETAEQAAKIMGVSTRSVYEASKVREHGTPELVQAVDQGKIKVSTAAILTKLPEEKQKENGFKVANTITNYKESAKAKLLLSKSY